MKELTCKGKFSHKDATIPLCHIKVEPLTCNNVDVQFPSTLYSNIPLKYEKDVETSDCRENIPHERLMQYQSIPSTSNSTGRNIKNNPGNIRIKLEDNLQSDKKPQVNHKKKRKNNQSKRAELRRNYKRLSCSEEKRLKKMLKRGIRSLAPSTLPIANVKNVNGANDLHSAITEKNSDNRNNNKSKTFIPFTKQQKRNIKKMIAKGMDADKAKRKEINRYNHFLKKIAEDMENNVIS